MVLRIPAHAVRSPHRAITKALSVNDDFERASIGSDWTIQSGSPSITSGDVGASAVATNPMHRTAETFSVDQFSEITLADVDLETATDRYLGVAVSVRHRSSDDARYNPIYGRPADDAADEKGYMGRWSLKLDGVAGTDTEYFAVKDRQHLRPTSEDANADGWTANGGPSTTYECVDDAAQDLTDPGDFNSENVKSGIGDDAPSDTDYVESPSNPSASVLRFGCTLYADKAGPTAGADPGTDKMHRLRIRYQKSGGKTCDLTWRLKQGTTVIESGSINGITTSWAETLVYLTASNVANITDYTNLFLEVEATASGGGSATVARVSYFELDIPDVMPVAGDVVRVEVTGTSGSTVVTAKKNGTTQLTGTPSGTTAAGYVDAGAEPGFPNAVANSTGAFLPYAAAWGGGNL